MSLGWVHISGWMVWLDESRLSVSGWMVWLDESYRLSMSGWIVWLDESRLSMSGWMVWLDESRLSLSGWMVWLDESRLSMSGWMVWLDEFRLSMSGWTVWPDESRLSMSGWMVWLYATERMVGLSIWFYGSVGGNLSVAPHNKYSPVYLLLRSIHNEIANTLTQFYEQLFYNYLESLTVSVCLSIVCVVQCTYVYCLLLLCADMCNTKVLFY